MKHVQCPRKGACCGRFANSDLKAISRFFLQRAKQGADIENEDLQVQLDEETKQKLAMQAKVREANDETNSLREQLEEVEDEKTAIQKILSQTQVQVKC